MKQWTISKRLFVLVSLGIFSVVGILVFSYDAIYVAQKGFVDLQNDNEALQYSNDGDMMHDALRADVFNAMLSDTPEAFQTVKADVAEHAKLFTDSYESVAKLDLDKPTRDALNEVLPNLQKYTKAANEFVALAETDKESVKANLPEFLAIFSLLEEKLGAFSELIAKGSEASTTHMSGSLEWAMNTLLMIAAISIPLLIGISFWMSRKINASLSSIVNQFTSIADQVSRGVEQLSSSSNALASASSKQAASLEETAASLEEVSSMVRQTADNSQQAKVFSVEVSSESESGVSSMRQMAMAIDSIKTAAEETASIVKTIDEIAFQTNLLALNAAVEAARAGDAGKGFAVVAEEVRALAQRSSSAAKDTSEKIRKSRELADNGVKVSREVRQSLESIKEKVGKTSSLVNEIAAATEEQSQGLKEVNKAASQLDQTNQANSAQAEELAASSHELVEQTKMMEQATDELSIMIYGTSGNRKLSAAPKPKAHIQPEKKSPPTTIKELSGSLPTEYQFKSALKSPAPTHQKAEEIIPLDDGDFQGF